MKIEVKRTPSVNGTTIGEMWIDGKFECYTCEDQIRIKGLKIPGRTAIWEGTYNVLVTMSNRFKKLLPLVENVSKFEGIRIHAGNTAEDTEGCILVGAGKGPLGQSITESRKALATLQPKIEAALAKGETVTLTITNPK